MIERYKRITQTACESLTLKFSLNFPVLTVYHMYFSKRALVYEQSYVFASLVKQWFRVEIQQ